MRHSSYAIDWEDEGAVIHADWYPGEPQTYWHPGAEPETEIYSIEIDGEEMIDALTDDDWEEVERIVDNHITDAHESAAEEAAIARYEERQYWRRYGG